MATVATSALINITCENHHEKLTNGLWDFFLSNHGVDFNFQWCGQTVRAHKLILDVFLSTEKLIRTAVGQQQQPAQHQGSELDFLLEFLYHGNVTIRQEQLEGLLEIARKSDFHMLVDALESAAEKQRTDDGLTPAELDLDDEDREVLAAQKLKREVEECGDMMDSYQDADFDQPHWPINAAGQAQLDLARKVSQQLLMGINSQGDGYRESDVASCLMIQLREEEFGHGGFSQEGDFFIHVDDNLSTSPSSPDKDDRSDGCCSLQQDELPDSMLRVEPDSLVTSDAAVKFPDCGIAFKKKKPKCAKRSDKDGRLDSSEMEIGVIESSMEMPVKLPEKLDHLPDKKDHLLDQLDHLPNKLPDHLPNKLPDHLPNKLPDQLCQMLPDELGEKLPDVVLGQEPEGLYKCNVCGKAFQKSALLLHKRTHSLEKSYECGQCHKKFSSHATLKMHTKVHLETKAFQCVVCGSSFTKLSHLQDHALIHKGERMYKCEVCNRAFKLRRALHTHVRSEHDTEQYRCDVCRKPFYERVMLERHKLSHVKK